MIVFTNVKNFKVLLHLASFIVLIFCTSNGVSGQNQKQLETMEREILQRFDSLKKSRNDTLRFALNERILQQFDYALKLPAAKNYSFDSLTSVARISDADNSFTFFHWNLQQQNGKHHYYGFLRINSREKSKIFALVDQSDLLSAIDSLILGPSNWFGSLYYKIISGKTEQGGQFYTLLGWSGKDNKVTCKVVEILTFDSEGKPQFGLPIFKNYKNGNNTRVIYRYSATTSMALKFEKQIVNNSKKWNPRKREFDSSIVEDWIIVADRLIPLDPMLEGQYQFYVPAGDVNDGFMMENGIWKFKTSIESRNKSH